ncbi:GGDEF domain-containing protein [Wenjunlia tyrosinilytica]|uniref:GGDEF domain-containing protein n=1 Tax=Wenjunlia tyrosinilytica TaxID=1544741 RepID=A0A917ZRM6_9ACTN|nr:GGDEF domain-containing protein [Wenjunlia tyrosinilytica]
MGRPDGSPGGASRHQASVPASVTERNESCKGVSASHLRDALAAAGIAVGLVDPEGHIREPNGALRAFGEGLEPLTHDDARSGRAYRELMRGERDRVRYTRRFKHRDGHTVWARVTLTPIREAGGAARWSLLTAEDITGQRELQQRLRHLRMHDPLTRLPNRELFFERLSSALGEGASGSRIGLCYLDVDGFKAVNDTLGHRIGDRLLSAVAERLAMWAEPAGHLVARLGGDEFAVLIEGSRGTAHATAVADAILGALDLPFDIEGQRLAVSASVGVVERPVSGTTPTGLMQAADTTLYWAKTDGKARWTLFDPERNAHRMTRQALSSTLRPAVERGEFVIEYQPLVGIRDGALRGAEALVRWRHPELGTLAPNRFIGLAEENGAIVQLGRWVLAESCRQARIWQLAHPSRVAPFVSVNVAVRQVWDSDLVADVAAILAETGLAPELLQLELTESAVMGSAGRPLQALHALSEMGVHIAIDDFGTGYSNLAYLSRLPVRGLKLDGSFVRGFGAQPHPNPADETIVTALVQLAHELGLTVTAECVESEAQARRLHAIGCDTAQGWFYSRPGPPELIDSILSGAPLRAVHNNA